MPDLYIIKLGGSVITEKEKNRFRAKEKVIARIASEIKKAMDERHFQLIVVHGAGPFGHTNVAKFGIDSGVFTEKHKKGLEKTIKDCNFLNSVVVEKLRKAGIEAVGIDPNNVVVQEDKKIVEFYTRGIEEALGEDIAPVLFGQMVPDKSLNASVMSGDAAIAFLAKSLSPKKVFLGTDVAGIFDADPKKEKNAKRIEAIDSGNFEEAIEKVSGSKAVDVTGGMRGKLLKLKEHLQGTSALIFDASQEGNVYRALAGKKVEGTELRF
ncbi:MAG: isopentenyl phosphate kinase family protein [Candidatus Diapherotrites archaeon]|uniref:Isopentenyl phosphate kinase n=1 Tax=Candidatus Iainarchaeum sp. TaxID=3101447 RepID=A0A939C9W4_9ARCH|nr:isopentenyl phosphate kinase family protein [Candidatus Diapherotrites archaeon]